MIPGRLTRAQSWADQLPPHSLTGKPRLHPQDPPAVQAFLEAGMTPAQIRHERALLAQERAS